MPLKRILAPAALVLFLTPLGAASPLDALQSPAWDDVTYDDDTGTLSLTWHPPTDNHQTQYTYHVYHNGERIASTLQNQFTHTLAPLINEYHVTAEGPDGTESPPSQPLLVQQHSGAPNNGGRGSYGPHATLVGLPPIDLAECGIVSIATYSHWPFVGIGVHEWCIPVIGKPLGPPAEIDGPFW